MSPPLWSPRPIAHRGLHRSSRGIVENTPSAIKAAIDRGYAIEVDLQPAKGSEPVVFHDETLDRLVDASGKVDTYTVAELRRLAYKATSDRILSLAELLELVDGRTPLLIEVKTMFGPPGDYERQIAAGLARYQGPLALMSFDPWSMMALRDHAPTYPARTDLLPLG